MTEPPKAISVDDHVVASIGEVGEDVCFETDCPHTDTTWPFVQEEVGG